MKQISRVRSLSLLAAAALASACADATGGPADAPVVPAVPAELLEVACRADLRAGAVSCGAPRASGARADLTVGGQRVYVTVRSSNIGITDVADPAQADTFAFDVTVQNLVPQALGTLDGTTPAPDGVRVFFHRDPVVTSGTGTVAVANPDGVTTFTRSEQPFFRYDAVLDSGEVSTARRWKLSYTPGVSQFEFVLFVSAPVQYPDGWVEVRNGLPSMASGTTRGVTAVIRDVVGRTVRGEAVTWHSSDSTVARPITSDSTTATLGAYRVGTTIVGASTALRPARGFAVQVTPGAVAAVVNAGRTGLNAAPGQALPDSVAVRVVDGQGNPVRNVFVQWTTPNGGSVSTGSSFTRADGTVRARWTVGAAAGPQELTATLSSYGAIAPVVIHATVVEQGTQRTWIGGAASGPTAWADPLNWEPAGVPTARDTAWVPATATGSWRPVLSADVSVTSLHSDGGIDLHGALLSVRGPAELSGQIDGPGRLQLLGDSRVEGRAPILLLQSAADSVRLTGRLAVDSVSQASGVLDLAGRRMEIVGGFAATGGTLLMRLAADSLLIGGGATFGGTSTLSAGTITVAGKWGVGTTNGQYKAIGTHRTVLDGAVRQDVYMPSNGSMFAHLEVRNPTGAYLTGIVRVQSNLLLTPGAQVFVALPGQLAGDVTSGTVWMQAGSRVTNNGVFMIQGQCINDSGNTIGPVASTGAACVPSTP